MSDTEVSVQQSSVETVATNGAKRGRGRPKKANTNSNTKAHQKSFTDNGVSNDNQTNGSNDSDEEIAAIPKKRGRKAKADKPNKDLKSDGAAVAGSGAVAAKRGRGRPPKKSAKGQSKRGRKPTKKNTRSESVDDEPQHNDDNTGDEEDRPEDAEEEEEDD